MNATELASALNAKKSGDGWIAKCVAHDDKHPSMSISEVDGKVLVKCHASCEQSDVIGELQKRGLWNGVDRNAAFTSHLQLGQPSALYDYQDATGQLIGRVMRFDRQGGKEIRQCSLQGDAWTWKAMPAPRPLYRLPSILKTDNAVLIVEGEKAVAAAAQIMTDMTVTTWAGGAKATDKTDFSCLNGRNVILWPDHDQPGRDAMQAIAGRLQGVAASVRMFDPATLGELPDGWDAADAMADKNCDLQAIWDGLTSAPELRKSGDPNVSRDALTQSEAVNAALDISDVSLAGLLDSPTLAPQWIYHSLLPSGAFLIVGRPKIGKSWLLLQFAMCAGAGADFLDYESDGACPGLYVASEDTDERIQRRLKVIGVRPPDNVRVWTQPVFRALAQKYSDKMTLLQFLDRYLQENSNTRFILLDTEETCRSIWDGERQTNNQQRITAVDYAQTRGFDELALRRKIFIGLVNHTRKGNGKVAGDPHELINRTNTALAGASGSMVLANYPDADPLDTSERKRLLAVRGRDLDDDLTLVVEHQKDASFKNLGPYYQVRQADAEQEVLEAIDELQADGADWLSVRDIAEQVNTSGNAVKKALARMRKGNRTVWNGKRLETKKGKGGGVRLTSVAA